jgi:tRNA pseudouridine32 synthase/23S rRNA pseudouridine746 synthase
MPHLLTRPSRDNAVEDVLDFPAACHRLDVATSGCLVVAKTKQAAVDFADQFASRKVKKTYTAILNGRPLMDTNSLHHKSPSDHLLKKMGLLSPNNHNEDDDHILASEWKLIDYPIENKDAVTLWRELQASKSLKASNQTLTLVEFHPLHGRKHQLRRHAVS